MKNYRAEALKFYKIVDELRAARRVIIDNEAHQPTIEKKLAKLNETARAKMTTLKKDLELEVNIYRNEATENFNKAIRKGKDQNRVGYVQVNATNAFDGLSNEEIIEKYPEYLAGLHPDDKPYKFVIDELVRNKIRGKADTEVINLIIEQNASAEEKVAAAEVASVQALSDSHLTLAGLMEGYINRIAEGQRPTDLDVAETFDGLISGHGNYKPAGELPGEFKATDPAGPTNE